MTTDRAAAAPDGESPLDRLLDVGVYAPIGFAVGFADLVPELAAAGRRQVAFSRSLGQAAIKSVLKAARPASAAPAARAVSGYDTMTARQIIDRCDSSTDAELAWMADRERAAKQRVTVLRALEAARESRRA